jgi:hypothetical protein
MVIGRGSFATLLASWSVPTFTGHLSVPQAHALETDQRKYDDPDECPAHGLSPATHQACR